MLRTVFLVGLMAILGLFALKFAFGLFAGLLGLFIALFFVAVKIAIIGAVVYLVIRILSPDTARRIRERWSGH